MRERDGSSRDRSVVREWVENRGITGDTDRTGLVLTICGRDALATEPIGPAGYTQWFQFTDRVQVCIVSEGCDADGGEDAPPSPTVPVLVDEADAVEEAFGVAVDRGDQLT